MIAVTLLQRMELGNATTALRHPLSLRLETKPTEGLAELSQVDNTGF